MPFNYNEFPNASYEDADLRELIRLYKELLATYDSLKSEIDEAIEYINNFEQNTDVLIKQEITVVMSLYTQRLINVEKLVKQLQEAIAEYPQRMDYLQTQITTLTADLKSNVEYLKNLHRELLEEFHTFKNGVGEYIDGRLLAFETEIRAIVTKLDRLDVTNPINGKQEDINKVLMQIYSSIQLSFGITAKEYDNLGITAREYDNLRISAIDYGTKGYFIFWELRQGLMLSPFTGKMTHYSNIIYKLAELHKCGFTAKQYDELEITAKDYDAWQISAFNYDWFGRKMILKKEGITALDYDNLRLKSIDYDNLNLSAYRYDTYGKAILNEQKVKTCECMSCNPDVLQPTN